jgi:hypothetical protein
MAVEPLTCAILLWLAAKSLGIEMPLSLLMRVTEVIE